MTEFLRLERLRGRLTVTLDHPPTRNALTAGLAAELQSVLTETASDKTLQVLILRGANGSFCAGADLKTALARMAQPIVPGEPDPVMVDNRNAGALFQSLNSHPQTTIAIVDGPAFGGGFGLACCADIVICTARARFALSETGLGLPPAQIAPYVVSRLGLRTTRRLALTGLRFDGREAAAIGLADYFCETAEALDTTLAMLLNGIGRCAPGANAVTKDLLLSLSPAGGDAYLDRAAAAFAACLRSAEGQEGVAAFNGKRAAHWVDDLS